MALVIVPAVGADSFITSAEYIATVGNLFGETVAADDPACRRAFLYMKSLPWSADYSFPEFGGDIPADILTAQAILARYEAATPNGLSPTVVPGQQKVLTRVGEISWTPTGQSGVDAQRAAVTMAQDLLKPYLSGDTRFLLRA